MKNILDLTLLLSLLVACQGGEHTVKTYSDTLTVGLSQAELWGHLQNLAIPHQDFLSIEMLYSVAPDSLGLLITPQRQHYSLHWDIVLEAIPPDSSRLYVTESHRVDTPLYKLIAKFVSLPGPSFRTSILKMIDQ